MKSGILPPCREIEIISFRGDRSRSFLIAISAQLLDQQHRGGPGPSPLEVVFFLGHAGLSMDGGHTYFGFGPDTGGLPTWQMLHELSNGVAFPGVVRDDTFPFVAARQRGLNCQSTKIVVPNSVFQRVANTLDAERRQSEYSYGYPDGDGDCNCLTWLERLGLPLLTGQMDEWERLSNNRPARAGWRFGKCQ